MTDTIDRINKLDEQIKLLNAHVFGDMKVEDTPKKPVKFASYEEAVKAMARLSAFTNLNFTDATWTFLAGDDKNSTLTLYIWFGESNDREFKALTKQECIEAAFEYYGWSVK